MKWSDNQLNVFEAAAGERSLQINAVAGSGKSTTLVEASKRLPPGGKIIALAFNKAIQEELGPRLPERIQCKTLNGLGFGLIAGHIKKRPIHYNWKDYDLLDAIGTPWNKRDEEFKAVLELVSIAKKNLMVPQGYPTPGRIPDELQMWYELGVDAGIDPSELQLTLAQKLLLKSTQEAFRYGKTNFDDQIYIPAAFPISIGEKFKFSTILVDEAQDLSAANHILLKKIARPDARVISFGDPHQSIYGFRGAHCHSMQILAADWNMLELPLSVSYRCAREIIREAQLDVQHIEAAEGAPLGIVDFLETWTAKGLMPGSHILCRNNKPLLALASALRRNGVPYELLGKDFLSQCLSRARSLAKGGGSSMGAFLKALEEWKKKYPKKREDMYESIMEFTKEKSNPKQVLEAIKEARDRKSYDPNRVTLSTVHKAKGKEWDRVYFLDSFLIPSTYAVSDDDFQQEKNLRYVARTRAKVHLTYIEMENCYE